jgi:hypothetical protein
MTLAAGRPRSIVLGDEVVGVRTVLGRVLWCPAAAVGFALAVVGVIAMRGWALASVVVGVLAGGALWWYARHPPINGIPLLVWSRFHGRDGRPRLGAPRAGADGSPAGEPESPAQPMALESMSTGDLCLAWRRSYLALPDLPAGSEHLAGEITRARAALLDELERRDPAGFTRWLAAGARASSDPARHLLDRA